MPSRPPPGIRHTTALGNELSQVLRAQSISIEELVKRIHRQGGTLSTWTVYNILNGTVKKPYLGTVWMIAQALNVGLGDLLDLYSPSKLRHPEILDIIDWQMSNKLTQEQAANHVGMDRFAYWKMVNNEAVDPTFVTQAVERIAVPLGSLPPAGGENAGNDLDLIEDAGRGEPDPPEEEPIRLPESGAEWTDEEFEEIIDAGTQLLHPEVLAPEEPVEETVMEFFSPHPVDQVTSYNKARADLLWAAHMAMDAYLDLCAVQDSMTPDDLKDPRMGGEALPNAMACAFEDLMHTGIGPQTDRLVDALGILLDPHSDLDRHGHALLKIVRLVLRNGEELKPPDTTLGRAFMLALDEREQE